MDRPRLYLNHDADYDWLIALEFGRVDDGAPLENWHVVSEDFAYLLEGPVGGRPIGFRVNGFSEFDADDPDVAIIWRDGPRFDAPLLGLVNASAGEIVVAARSFLEGRSSVNRLLFDDAVGAATPEEALAAWRDCLQAGDSMAHYGLGYTLYELGRHREAYRHLRAYAELVPTNEWAWCWLGTVCEALGERDEAIAAYQRAIELERQDGAEETDAEDRLEGLQR